MRLKPIRSTADRRECVVDDDTDVELDELEQRTHERPVRLDV